VAVTVVASSIVVPDMICQPRIEIGDPVFDSATEP
jgi:hypothetical protein